MEYFQIDQTCTINKNLIEELNHLSESLIHFLHQKKSIDICLFQNPSTNEIPAARNANCYPCNLTQPTSRRMPPCSKPMEEKTPICFSTPVVYTPEMETLFSSGGIIYARKSGKPTIVL